MTRAYSRDSRGRFGASGSKGDRAETIQQNRAKHANVKRQSKDALSGGHQGGGRKHVSIKRAGAIGKRATTKAMRASLARAKGRFS